MQPGGRKALSALVLSVSRLRRHGTSGSVQSRAGPSKRRWNRELLETNSNLQRLEVIGLCEPPDWHFQDLKSSYPYLDAEASRNVSAELAR